MKITIFIFSIYELMIKVNRELMSNRPDLFSSISSCSLIPSQPEESIFHLSTRQQRRPGQQLFLWSNIRFCKYILIYVNYWNNVSYCTFGQWSKCKFWHSLLWIIKMFILKYLRWYIVCKWDVKCKTSLVCSSFILRATFTLKQVINGQFIDFLTREKSYIHRLLKTWMKIITSWSGHSWYELSALIIVRRVFTLNCTQNKKREQRLICSHFI